MGLYQHFDLYDIISEVYSMIRDQRHSSVTSFPVYGWNVRVMVRIGGGVGWGLPKCIHSVCIFFWEGVWVLALPQCPTPQATPLWVIYLKPTYLGLCSSYLSLCSYQILSQSGHFEIFEDIITSLLGKVVLSNGWHLKK